MSRSGKPTLTNDQRRRPMMNIDIEALFKKVEAEIDLHHSLRRVPGIRGEPELVVCRLGSRVRIPVTLVGSRKKPSTISGSGNTPEEAAEALIRGLDHWAEAIK